MSNSPLLAAILLAIDLCQRPDQLAAWWDWPAHRDARWRLSPDEQATASQAAQRRRAALESPPPDPGIPPPSAVLPPIRRRPGYDGRRLI
jgi:hypothetical protein